MYGGILSGPCDNLGLIFRITFSTVLVSNFEVYIIEAGACRDETRERGQLAVIIYAYRGKVLVKNIGFGDVMG